MVWIKQLFSSISPKLLSAYYKNIHSHEGVNFFDKDWDNLLIIDACRYDIFEQTNNIEGDLQSIQSVGSQTEEFFKKTIHDKSFNDTVYISSNPQISKVDSEFCEVINLWESCWSEELGTIPPDRVAEVLLRINKTWSDKKIVAHFVQPHMPFIGDTGKKMDLPRFEGGSINKNQNNKDFVWSKLARGDVSEELVWKAYKENLEIVLDVIKEVLDELTGKTIITSDHGNAFGEKGIYGHPANIHIDALTTVPWLVVNNGDRKLINECERLKSTKQGVSGTAKKRLESLGYV
jgi:hypothetical protein